MTDFWGESLGRMVEELAALPGIGKKSAERLAFFLLGQPKERVQRLTGAISEAKEKIHFCAKCQTFTDRELCPICGNPRRDGSQIMVVETPRDMAAYEKTGRFEGLYHVLHGVISPMLGVGPSDIRLNELLERLKREDVQEVILATGASLEGETTAMYIARLIKPAGIRTTRIASGIPVGGELDNIDEVTLLRALEGRVEL